VRLAPRVQVKVKQEACQQIVSKITLRLLFLLKE
jgi:hypothetical protein